MQTILITVIFGLALGCNASKDSGEACIDPAKIDNDAMCTQQYAPVCGCDGKTYGNDCEAQKAGVTSWQEGECGEADNASS